MSNTLDFDYTDYREEDEFQPTKYPAVGTYQVIEITSAEYKEFDSGAKKIGFGGTFSEYEKTSFYSQLWIPRNQGDDDAFARERSRFLGTLAHMGIQLKKGMLLEDVASQMVGRFARSKVKEEQDYKDADKKWIVPSYLNELTIEQKKTYINPSNAAAAAFSSNDESKPTSSGRRGFGRA